MDKIYIYTKREKKITKGMRYRGDRYDRRKDVRISEGESERERMVENVVTNPSVEIKEGKKDFGRVGHGWRHGKSKQPPPIGG